MSPRSHHFFNTRVYVGVLLCKYSYAYHHEPLPEMFDDVIAAACISMGKGSWRRGRRLGQQVTAYPYHGLTQTQDPHSSSFTNTGSNWMSFMRCHCQLYVACQVKWWLTCQTIFFLFSDNLDESRATLSYYGKNQIVLTVLKRL